MSTQHNAVKSPLHYTEGRKYEPKDVIRDWRLNFNLGSALKYIARAGRKDDIVQDLKKAQEYLQFEIDAIEAERKEQEKKHNDKLDAMLYGLDPFMRAVVRNELCSVKPIIVDVPEGVDPEEFIADLKKKLKVELK
jgi:hypothetical protein